MALHRREEEALTQIERGEFNGVTGMALSIIRRVLVRKRALIARDSA
jgi:hypothetical protein